MKIRLDHLLVKHQIADTIELAERLIRAGKVMVDETIIDKPGIPISTDCSIRLKEKLPFVSRGGLKLEAGLKNFQIDPTGMICADIGVSTGGFTDCLLQYGAKKVYGVDVGYGQIDWKLRQDPRVVLIERFNARNITNSQIPEPLDLAVIDVSFISLTTIIPPLLPLFGKTIDIISLVKPQFELPSQRVAKGGIVSDPNLHQEAIDKITAFGNSAGLVAKEVIPSPILGAKGNREFLLHLHKSQSW